MSHCPRCHPKRLETQERPFIPPPASAERTERLQAAAAEVRRLEREVLRAAAGDSEGQLLAWADHYRPALAEFRLLADRNAR